MFGLETDENVVLCRRLESTGPLASGDTRDRAGRIRVFYNRHRL